MSKHPEVLWAQRSHATVVDKNIIYLTINLPNIHEESLEYSLTSTSLSFKAQAGPPGGQVEPYAFDLELYTEIDTEYSTRRISSRSITAILRKKESKSDYWPRLTKEKIKTPFIKTDFSKWVDEDEQDGNPTTNADDDDLGELGGGFPPGMGGMAGMGGMGGMAGMGGMGGMAGMGGLGGMGQEFDFSKLGNKLDGAGLPDELGHDSDSDEEGIPPLEDPEPAN